MSSRPVCELVMRNAVRAMSAFIAISLVAACTGQPGTSPNSVGVDSTPAASAAATLPTQPTPLPPVPTTQPSPSASATPTLPPTPLTTERSTRGFGVPASMVVPSSWTEVNDGGTTYYFAGRSRVDVDEPLVGIDLALVTNTYVDPCRRAAGQLEPPLGPSPHDLVDYMLALELLDATPAGTITVDGHEGQVIDEAFKRSVDCPELWLWDGGTGNVYSRERKRYIVLDVDGQRVVVVIVAWEPQWDTVLPEAMEVVESIDFKEP